MTDKPGELLQQAFTEHNPERVKVAFSGGADSSALLLKSAEVFPGPLLALHVNHGVTADASRWADHCSGVAKRLGVAFECRSVERRQLPSSPNEAQLRDARYRLLAEDMAAGDLLLTAHHADDLAETVLLAALRGGSSHELAGIPRVRRLGRGTLCRPWLPLTRRTLLELLQSAGLTWLEDPANESHEVRRSFLRQQIMPLLEQRWPDAAASLAATAQRQTGTAAALDELLDLHLAGHPAQPHCLSADALDGLSSNAQLFLLQRFLVREGVALPPMRRLNELLAQRLRCAEDRLPELKLRSHCLRCYRRSLYLLADPQRQPSAAVSLRWAPRQQAALTLDDGSRLIWCGKHAPAELCVRLGERNLRVVREGEQQHRQLSKVFQQLGIPPWARAATPLIFRQDRLIQIGNAWRSRELTTFLAERKQQLVWKPNAG